MDKIITLATLALVLFFLGNWEKDSKQVKQSPKPGSTSPQETVGTTAPVTGTADYDAAIAAIKATPLTKKVPNGTDKKGRVVYTMVENADRVAVAAPLFTRVAREEGCPEVKPEMLGSTWRSEASFRLGEEHGEPVKDNEFTVKSGKFNGQKHHAQGPFQVVKETTADGQVQKGRVPNYRPQNFILSARMAVRVYCDFIHMFPGNLEYAIRAYGAGQEHLLPKNINNPKFADVVEWSAGYWRRYSARLEEYRALIAAANNNVVAMR